MLAVALVHYPCLNKNGEVISTAITNLDLHDIARVCLTYGADPLYIVHPYQSQRDFARRIMDHWLTGYGGAYNPIRRMAFEGIQVKRSLDEVREETGAVMIGTTARGSDRSLSWDDGRGLVAQGDACLVFGTGWGMAPELMSQLDVLLAPIQGRGSYNHLSVRSAVSITLDRIIGR